MRFFKYQALGNDYLVVDGVPAGGLDPALIRRICDRHLGIGSDGILVGGVTGDGAVTVSIFNPDASEAEKSGNGVRIFARYAWDVGLVQSDAFTVRTKGGAVRCEVRQRGRLVFAEMGRASFRNTDVPVGGPDREVIDEPLPGHPLRFTAVSVGNPHCVVHLPAPTAALAHELGPQLERHPLFPARTNVQLVEVISPHELRIEIWERGAGYTLASGTSACAAAAASVRLGRCTPGEITVRTAGGTLAIGVSPDYALTMLGPVTRVADGVLCPELIELLV
jgi:diaminopimelate epimerase